MSSSNNLHHQPPCTISSLSNVLKASFHGDDEEDCGVEEANEKGTLVGQWSCVPNYPSFCIHQWRMNACGSYSMRPIGTSQSSVDLLIATRFCWSIQPY